MHAPDQPPPSAPEKPTWRTIAPRALSIVILLGLTFVGYRIFRAPIHGVHDAAACERAYAAARTHRDSISVDFLSYPDASGRPGNNRCGYLPKKTAKASLP